MFHDGGFHCCGKTIAQLKESGICQLKEINDVEDASNYDKELDASNYDKELITWSETDEGTSETNERLWVRWARVSMSLKKKMSHLQQEFLQELLENSNQMEGNMKNCLWLETVL